MAEPDFDVEFMGVRFTDPEVFGETLRRAKALIDASSDHAKALGELCIAYSALDWTLTLLYVPLLQCSEAQAVCIADENISRRCASAKKLLHLEDDLPQDWLDWAVALLGRADGELGGLRNRLIHDSYHINETRTVRIDRRAKMAKPQSRKKTAITYNTEHAAPLTEIERVDRCVGTVSWALLAATQNLAAWRLTGQPPVLDPQWLPACKPRARGHLQVWSRSEQEAPPPPSHYEFD
jgi:hypothetical protein